MRHEVTNVVVRGLIGTLTITWAPPGDGGVTAEVVAGRFEHQLTFADSPRLSLRPSRHPQCAEGAIGLMVPPGMTVCLVGCYGKWVRPDGEIEELDGACVAWTVA